MKSRVALIAATLLASAVALAQAHDGAKGHKGPDMDRMAVLLDLNDTQKAEVQKILDEQHDKLKAAHDQAHAAGTRPTRDERAKFHDEMKQDTVTKLQGVLSADQIKKFEVLMDHAREHRGHGDTH
jgi:Spy/CpxP family protein refolding chaperone